MTRLQAITVKPTTLNSGLACRNTVAKVEGHSIYLTIITSVAGEGLSAICPAAVLGTLPDGNYIVYYRGSEAQAVKLGEVSIRR